MDQVVYQKSTPFLIQSLTTEPASMRSHAFKSSISSEVHKYSAAQITKKDIKIGPASSFITIPLMLNPKNYLPSLHHNGKETLLASGYIGHMYKN